MTLERCDAFIHQLAKISGRAVPEWLERQRGQLQDAMIDCHMWLRPAHGDSGGRRSAGGVV
jgi:nitrogenase molybdenum-iron protein NifN